MAFGLTLLDFGERLFGTWWVVPPWLRLTSALIGFTAAQFLAYSDLHNMRLTEKMELLHKIEELSTRRYTQAQLDLVNSKIKGLEGIALKVVRFLLQNGTTDHVSLERQMQLPADVLNAALRSLSERMLITGNTEPNTGRMTWDVNEKFRPMLEELLFTEKEGTSSLPQLI